MKKRWSKAFIETKEEGGVVRFEIETPVYPRTQKLWQKHTDVHKFNKEEDCFYCRETNGFLTLEQEKLKIKSINKLVEEKKKENNV